MSLSCPPFSVTIVSVLRLHALVTFSNSTNYSYDNFEIHLWSTIEINVGIICACMPAMRQMLVWLFPVVFGGTTQREQSRYYGSGRQQYFNVPRSPGWMTSKPSTRNGSRVALARSNTVLGTVTTGRPGPVQKLRGSVSMGDVKANKVQRSFYFDEEAGSPVQMREFVSDGVSHDTG